MLAALFEKEGLSVLTATSGSEALRIARACRGGFDLLLSDVEMPGMDGTSLARQLRAELPGLGIILMSGSWDPALARIDMPVHFVAKPFCGAHLARIARGMLDAQGRGTPG